VGSLLVDGAGDFELAIPDALEKVVPLEIREEHGGLSSLRVLRVTESDTLWFDRDQHATTQAEGIRTFWELEVFVTH
jgi:hypothetical protein